MDISSTSPDEKQPRDAAYWAEQSAVFKVAKVPTGALNLVEGRQGTSPLQGFGQMWQKTYRMRLKGGTVKPIEVIKMWKENFPKFWPQGNRFYAPLTGITPGEVALLSLSVGGGMQLSTGVMVLYADEESFTLMTPQGHMFAGWITFSAYQEGDETVVQAQVLMRASDPIYELGMRFGGHRQEDTFWEHTLKALAAHLDSEVQVETRVICVDPKRQWSQARNIWQNAAMRTTMYRVTAPVRWIGRSGRRG